MTKEELDTKIEEWHESDSEMDIHEYLNMTREQYSLYVEFDILPGDSIPVNTFMQLRKDAYRWANDADNRLEENRRYAAAVQEIRGLVAHLESPQIDEEIYPHQLTEILDRHNV